MRLEWRYFKQREEPVQSTKGGLETAEWCAWGVGFEGLEGWVGMR